MFQIQIKKIRGRKNRRNNSRGFFLPGVLGFMMILGMGSLPTPAHARSIAITVKGMVCSFCAQGIKKKLLAEPGVEKVEVNLGEHRVRIETKVEQGKDQDVADDRIKSILTDAGYNVSDIQRVKQPAKQN